MKSEWKVETNTINGKEVYGVFRIKDTNQVNHSGNREYYGIYLGSKDEAMYKAKHLNITDNWLQPSKGKEI